MDTETRERPEDRFDEPHAAGSDRQDEEPVHGVRALRYRRKERNRWMLAIAALLTILAGGLRFYHLSYPTGYIFDEVYYAKDGCLDAGFDYRDCQLEHDGEQTITVHPPLGRELIALGEKRYGNREFGWRVASAVAGTLTIPLLAVLAYLLFDSLLWGAAAGLLLATEHLNFVQSRISMLDIFIALFVVAGFLFLVLDRRWIDRRTPPPERLEPVEREEAEMLDLPPDRPPSPVFRPWRILAGLSLGAAASVKWSGGTALLGAILLTIGWERARRKRAGLDHTLWETIRDEGFGIFVFLVLVPIAVYLASYFRWMGGHGGYLDIEAWRQWWDLQAGMARFSLTLTSEHPYSSAPWSWPLMMRPVAYYYVGDKPPGTAAEVLGMGNPAIFWGGTAALIWATVAWFRDLGRSRVLRVLTWSVASVAAAALAVVGARALGPKLAFVSHHELEYVLFLFVMVFMILATISQQERNWVTAFVCVAFYAQYLPWLGTSRTSFLFYMTPMTPFMVLASVWALRRLSEVRLGVTQSRSLAPLAAAGVVLSVVLFAWFFPVITGQTLSHFWWHARIWFAFPGAFNWI